MGGCVLRTPVVGILRLSLVLVNYHYCPLAREKDTLSGWFAQTVGGFRYNCLHVLRADGLVEGATIL